MLRTLPACLLCRRFSASEGARLLAAWASLRRRQPFNPGGRGQAAAGLTGAGCEAGWQALQGAAQAPGVPAWGCLGSNALPLAPCHGSQPAASLPRAHPRRPALAHQLASCSPCLPCSDAYNFADLSRHLAASVDQLSGGELQAVAGAAPAFSWPVYASVPLLHAVCREAVHRWAGEGAPRL